MDFHDYISLVEESNSYDRVTFPPDATRDEVISRLMEISDRKLEIKNACDKILEEYVFKFEKTDELISEEDYSNLREFANELNGHLSGFENVLQMHIARILLRQNVLRKNRELASRNVATLSITENDLGNRGFVDGVGEYASMVADYLLDSRGFDFYSRDLLLIGLCNYVASYGEFGVSLRAMRLMLDYYESFSDEEKESGYVMSALMLGCTYFTEETVYEFDSPALARKCGKPAEDFELSSEERDFIFSVMKLQTELVQKCKMIEGLHVGELEINLYQNRCKMYLGIITPEELVDFIRTTQKECEARQLSPVDEYCARIMYSCMEIKYRFLFLNEDQDEFARDAWEIFKNAMINVQANNELEPALMSEKGAAELMYTASFVVDFETFRDMLYRLTVCENIPLHIHTRMVEEIAMVIGYYIIRENPEYFNGVMGYDTDYIIAHKYEIMGTLGDCAKMHDIGKLFCLDYTTIAYRKLLNEEFDVIKLHTTNFTKVYAGEGSEKVRCVRDCARLHHRYYNEDGGYMEYMHTKNKPFVNILSVADSIDAATDTIGRPYARRKSFEDLLGEFREMAGTRYDKYICDIVELPEVKEKIRYIIEEKRKDINYEIYMRKGE